MTVIVAFLVAHIGSILAGLVALAGVAFGFVKSKSADTKVAHAGQTAANARADAAAAKQQVAEERDAESQANAAAARQAAVAQKERADVENDVAVLPVGSAADQLRNEWSRPGEDAGRGTAGAGQDPVR